MLTATTTVDRQIRSHLNRFTEIWVSRHHQLSLRFSPVPREKIAVLPSDYP